MKRNYSVFIGNVEACHKCAELGYVTSSGGNLSYRLGDGNILITPTKRQKEL